MKKLNKEDINSYIKENNINVELINIIREKDNRNKSRTYLVLKCENGHEYKQLLENFKRGSGCSKCIRPFYDKNTEQFKNQVKLLTNNDFIVKGEYVNGKTEILMYHISCDCEFLVKPFHFLHTQVCPKCSKTRKKTTEDFKDKVFKLVKDEYEVIDEYVSIHKYIKIKHNICGESYNVYPSNFLRGKRCPFCNESKGEQKIRKYLNNKFIYFEQEYIFNNLLSDLCNPLRFDFAIFEDKYKTILKCLIEYDGEFHYKSIMGKDKLSYTIKHDKIKNEYCKINNIKLVRIPYWEFDNIEIILEKIFSKDVL